MSLIWTARASNVNYSQLATSSRNVNLIIGDIGFELIAPLASSVILGKDGNVIQFVWDSVPLENTTYEWAIDTVNGDLLNPLTTFPSNNTGSSSNLDAAFNIIDSVLNVFNIARGDTLDAKWTVKATTSKGDVFPLTTFGIKIFRDLAEGINEVLSKQSLNVYPNPAQDYLYITTDNASNKPLNIELYNTNGQLIQAYINANNSPINIQNISSGSYVLRVVFSDGIAYRKVVIN